MASEKTIRRECSALVEAAEELRCENLYVLTYDDKRTIEWEGRPIHIIPAFEWSTL